MPRVTCWAEVGDGDSQSNQGEGSHQDRGMDAGLGSHGSGLELEMRNVSVRGAC